MSITVSVRVGLKGTPKIWAGPRCDQPRVIMGTRGLRLLLFSNLGWTARGQGLCLGNQCWAVNAQHWEDSDGFHPQDSAYGHSLWACPNIRPKPVPWWDRLVLAFGTTSLSQAWCSPPRLHRPDDCDPPRACLSSWETYPSPLLQP